MAEKPFVKESQSVDKLRYTLIEPEFKRAMASILTQGAKKYDAHNWKKCEDKDMYKDALLRHLEAYLSGEYLDEEMQESHLASIACNAMFLLHMEQRERNEQQPSNS